MYFSPYTFGLKSVCVSLGKMIGFSSTGVSFPEFSLTGVSLGGVF